MFFIGLKFMHNMFLGSKPNRKTVLFIGEHLIAKKKKKIGDGENEEGKKNKQNDNRQNVKGLWDTGKIYSWQKINIVCNIYIKNIFDLLKK